MRKIISSHSVPNFHFIHEFSFHLSLTMFNFLWFYNNKSLPNIIVQFRYRYYFSNNKTRSITQMHEDFTYCCKTKKYSWLFLFSSIAHWSKKPHQCSRPSGILCKDLKDTNRRLNGVRTLANLYSETFQFSVDCVGRVNESNTIFIYSYRLNNLYSHKTQLKNLTCMWKSD